MTETHYSSQNLVREFEVKAISLDTHADWRTPAANAKEIESIKIDKTTTRDR